ncbi:MAG: winged helix-turn-helix transcriptional regulator [Gammaproteobacteria bacterium]|nr:winged helix-turn-helix transcriptional regulator [Gammaproteobacteria bacterium]MCP4994395.1 winged helix-turn-helix transcriptional regulator [Gammaproteobacteria bacterium]
MELETTAKRLAELGHNTRLSIFRYLVKCGPDGCPVGELQRELAIPGSTLSHHLGRLMSAGLVEQRRDGRTLYCLPVFTALNEVINFLTDECCAGSCAA